MGRQQLDNPRPGENNTPESGTLIFRAVFETFLRLLHVPQAA
jgi:hypothetical protein